MKDIVAESAASYVSILQLSEKDRTDPDALDDPDLPTAFSLARFIPLLQDRIHVIQPFTRNFLVSWLTLLDTIPDLELVSYLPDFLEGLIKFLGGPNKDVNVATQNLLDRFLAEIKRITRLKKGIEESRKGQKSNRHSAASDSMSVSTEQNVNADGASDSKGDIAVEDSDSESIFDGEIVQADGDWIPGQDVQIDHPKILGILVGFVNTTYEEEMQLTALRWIDAFFEISPEDILPFVPRLLTQVLPAMSSGSDGVRQAANQVNKSLLEYIYSLSDDTTEETQASSKIPSTTASKETIERRSSTPGVRPSETASIDIRKQSAQEASVAATPRSSGVSTPLPTADLDYAAAVNSLTLQFLNENEATRVAALSWLIMLHRKAPRKVVAFNDGTFPALLKTLSDPAEAVVTKDLQLLSQISRNSEDSYFTSFMVNLLQLFSTDRHLLEVRGNLIIRQLCLNLSPERIYRTLADCLEKEEVCELIFLQRSMLTGAGSRICQYHGAEFEQQSHHCARALGVKKALEKSRFKSSTPPTFILCTEAHKLFRMGKCFLLLCSGHGATTLCPPFLSVFLLKRMSRHTTYFRSCQCTSSLDYGLLLTLAQCRTRDDNQHADSNR